MRISLYFAVSYLVLGTSMFSVQTRIIFPGHETQGRPEAEIRPGAGYELLRLKTRSDVPIAALYGQALDAHGQPIADATSRPTLLYFYGNGMCLKTAQARFEQFRKMGFNVMIPEYQGYGMSGGSPSERGCQDTADTAYEYLLLKRSVHAERLVIGGWSLGGAVAIDLASRRRAGALFAFSTFTSGVEMAKRVAPLMPVALLLRHRFDSIGKIPKVQCPILIAHGRRDRIVPFSMGPRLAQAAKVPVLSLWIDDADHNDFYQAGGELVEQAIRRLIADLPEAPAGR